MTREYDYITLANSAKIPVSIRTLKSFVVEGQPPWVALGYVIEALTYLARRIDMDEKELLALSESLDGLYSSVKALPVVTDGSALAKTENTSEP